MTAASKSMTAISDVKRALKTTFHIENRERLHCFPILRIKQEEGKVTVDQGFYIETMRERFQINLKLRGFQQI